MSIARNSSKSISPSEFLKICFSHSASNGSGAIRSDQIRSDQIRSDHSADHSVNIDRLVRISEGINTQHFGQILHQITSAAQVISSQFSEEMLLDSKEKRASLQLFSTCGSFVVYLLKGFNTSDQIRSDQIRSDQIKSRCRSDKTRWDQIGSDRITVQIRSDQTRPDQIAMQIVLRRTTYRFSPSPGKDVMIHVKKGKTCAVKGCRA